MESVKKPEVIISGANAVALIFVTIYFYKQIGDLENEISELKKNLSNTVTQTHENNKNKADAVKVASLIQKLRANQERIIREQRLLKEDLDEQHYFCSNVSKFCKKVNEESDKKVDVDIEFEDSQPQKNNNRRFNRNERNERNERNTRGRRRQNYNNYDDLIEDDYDDFQEDNYEMREREPNYNSLINRLKGAYPSQKVL